MWGFFRRKPKPKDWVPPEEDWQAGDWAQVKDEELIFGPGYDTPRRESVYLVTFVSAAFCTKNDNFAVGLRLSGLRTPSSRHLYFSNNFKKVRPNNFEEPRVARKRKPTPTRRWLSTTNS